MQKMLLFGVLCLVAFTAAMPAPSDDGLHTNAMELSAGKEEPEMLSPIPDPPQLEPIEIFLVDNNGKEEAKEPGKDAEKPSSVSGNEEPALISEPGHENIGGEIVNPDQGVVIIQDNGTPSFITNFFPFLSNLSWPSWPSNFSIQPSTWNLPSFPNIFGRQVLYTNPPQPNYRYFLI